MPDSRTNRDAGPRDSGVRDAGDGSAPGDATVRGHDAEAGANSDAGISCMNATTTELNTSHVPMLSQPKAVAAVILNAAASTVGAPGVAAR